jgi:hypothetical protein
MPCWQSMKSFHGTPEIMGYCDLEWESQHE